MKTKTNLQEIETKTIINKNEKYKNNIFDKEIVNKLLKSEEDIENGRTRKAAEVIMELKTKYGF